MFKKIIAVSLCAASVSGLAACGTTNEGTPAADADKISVVTTIFPEYDWTKEIIGDSDAFELTMLMDNGVDMHSYQASVDDIVKISECDLFVYVGGESDQWVKDTLASATNKDMKVVNLMEVLGDKVKEEELVEGMQAEEEGAGKEGADENEKEFDEHVWLSVKNAQVFTDAIADKLAELDSGNAQKYKDNASSYKEKLITLDAGYTDAVKNGPKDTIIFADRFPFRYLTEDYNLKYYAAFSGCSADSEASFETITFLANKVDELGVKSVLKLETSDGKIAGTVVDATKDKNQQILTMNSMQAVTSDNINNGATYLGIMEENLNVLKTALQ